MNETAARPSLHVLVRREDIDASRLDGRVVVVIDVLFATSTIVHALASGASRHCKAENGGVLSALRIAASRAAHSGWP